MTARCPLHDDVDAPVRYRSVDQNRRCSDATFTYRCCTRCGLVFLEDVPDDLGRYYAEEYYALPSPEGLDRAATADAYQIDLVERHAPPGRLVEVGPAWGIFARQAVRRGFEVEAIEMDARCCDYLRDVVRVAVHRSDEPEAVLPSLAPSRVVALWQVVEHLPAPWATLEAAAANLEVGGVLVLATPNPEAVGLRLMGASWPHLDAPRHLWLIPIDVLTGFLSDRGLKLAHLSTTDQGARHWNRFAWQRLLMNRVRRKPARIAAYAAGTATALALTPLERRDRNGATYTAVFRKVSA